MDMDGKATEPWDMLREIGDSKKASSAINVRYASFILENVAECQISLVHSNPAPSAS
jgi:hypothetical protein